MKVTSTSISSSSNVFKQELYTYQKGTVHLLLVSDPLFLFWTFIFPQTFGPLVHLLVKRVVMFYRHNSLLRSLNSLGLILIKYEIIFLKSKVGFLSPFGDLQTSSSHCIRFNVIFRRDGSCISN